MRMTFKLRYHTQPGQSIWLLGNHSLLGGGKTEDALPLHFLDSETWQLILLVPTEHLPLEKIAYRYLLREKDESAVQDCALGHWLDLRAPVTDDLVTVDSWNPIGQVENVFYTEPFLRVFRKMSGPVQTPPPTSEYTHTFRVHSPAPEPHEVLCLAGNTPELGDWDPARARSLSRETDSAGYAIHLQLRKPGHRLEYKYCLVHRNSRMLLRWEEGPNRRLDAASTDRTYTVVNDGFVRLPPPNWRGAGVAVPVFSLRSRDSFGVGEFSDIRRLADWAAKTGLKLIQLLPINDTTATRSWTDSYPYAAISAFALHPLYIRLSEISGEGAAWLNDSESERHRLNSLEHVDYATVMEVKHRLLHRAYSLFGESTLADARYHCFLKENQSWLVPYAIFSHLRDDYGTADYQQWPKYNSYEAKTAAELLQDPQRNSAIQFYLFVQYHLHLQFKGAVDYVHALGIAIKGDIPIGVGRHGADTWENPGMFYLNKQAGAPPDPFAAKGQNWGFPTYNWERMKADDFRWWRQRFAQMDRYFDLFRIDHILGFFRIWSIPLHAVEGILGSFFPALPVTTGEFISKGVPFRTERFAQPWITDRDLEQLFGADSDSIKELLLSELQSGRYQLKPEFRTQRQIKEHWNSLPEELRSDRVRLGLYDLISNVILLVDEERFRVGEFHFRFNAPETSSFRALDATSRRHVYDLYIDYYFRRQESFWRDEAMQKLPELKQSTRMLICGEDLGLVPATVPDVMKELGLLSLEVQRMPKYPGKHFSRPSEAPYLSVVTPSTHDMSPLRGWWLEDRAITQLFFETELNLPGEAPPACAPSLCQLILSQHLTSPAMWSIFQIQDLLALDKELCHENPEDERINIPANPQHYWRYRMKPTLEGLNEAAELNATLKELITSSGR